MSVFYCRGGRGKDLVGWLELLYEEISIPYLRSGYSYYSWRFLFRILGWVGRDLVTKVDGSDVIYGDVIRGDVIYGG